MKIDSIRLKNFKAFREVEMRDLPGLCVLIGANGTGKSTLFSVFGFLKDALTDNVHVALTKLGGSRGFAQVRSRNAQGPIEIEIKFRESADSPLVTYFLAISEDKGRPVIEHEILKYRRGSKGRPWHFLDFSKGTGKAVTNEPDKVADEADLQREDPFLARHVSDGTIKMFAYLVLLHDPEPHPLLCVEEPENQLYPKLLGELAEEFRNYASRGGQVFVSTHSGTGLHLAANCRPSQSRSDPLRATVQMFSLKGPSNGLRRVCGLFRLAQQSRRILVSHVPPARSSGSVASDPWGRCSDSGKLSPGPQSMGPRCDAP